MLKELLELSETNTPLTSQLRAAIAAKYIVELSSEGITDATIALFLNSKGVTSAHGCLFSESNIRKIRQRIRDNEKTNYRLGWN